MSVDLKTGKHKIICSYPGLNMQPAFTPSGNRAVLCLSGGRGNSELYLYDPSACKKAGRKVFKPLTNNRGHNVSPCVLANNDVVFCSDFASGQPQIYYLNMKTKQVRRLTSGKGYCAAPSYCAKTNKLVYIRPVKGAFQLFSLSLDNLNAVGETQITSCAGSKQEPSWSECGRYIIFSIDQNYSKRQKVPQIAAMNYNSGQIRIMTNDQTPKSFPRWCPRPIWSELA